MAKQTLGDVSSGASDLEQARDSKNDTQSCHDDACANVVQFDFLQWKTRFPAVAGETSAEEAAVYFDMAQRLFLSNAPTSLVKDMTTRRYLLELLVAHFAWILRSEANGGPGAGAVGPVVQATQGSISVQYALAGQSPAATWFMQSQYGATYWQATSFWRGMRFVASQSPRARYWP